MKMTIGVYDRVKSVPVFLKEVEFENAQPFIEYAEKNWPDAGRYWHQYVTLPMGMFLEEYIVFRKPMERVEP